ncbi:MFS general substrate transporter [Fistulina hepatica ATCC 64428]|uniref:MFS general substrate transporter n=1 Tax=Fistulina hepatica ATCC 64428 TaxID=1128425 RepID=A0A0D7A8H9_9AGAR|nr:MFS general substrate transporter [Fistulina hepatica ATCC 64428]
MEHKGEVVEALPVDRHGEVSHHIHDYDVDPQAERALVRKLDKRIAPLVFCLYLFNALDRSNLGNAETDGFTTDLHFGTNDYSLMLSLFYIPFCCLTFPGVALTKKIGAHITLPLYMMVFGAMVMINAGVKNIGGCLVVRILIGAAEAGFATSIIWYLTTFYRRGELAKRVAAFYSASAFSGAVSGLIAYGVFQADSALYGWQLLFLIEGGVTVLIALLSVFILPRNIETANFLNDEEKRIATLRVLKDSSHQISQKLTVAAFFKPLADWKVYVLAVIGICYGTAASSVSIFLPQIIERMETSTLRINLLTVAPNFVGGLWVLLMSASSDYFRERSLHLSSSMALTMIGFIILSQVPVENTGVQYFATFLCCMGAFVPSVLFHVFHNCNDPSDVGRGFRTAFLTFFANSAGLIASNIFMSSEAPKYPTALKVNFALLAVGIALVLGLRTYMMLDNRKRNKAQGANWTDRDVPTAALALGPKSPEFRYFL